MKAVLGSSTTRMLPRTCWRRVSGFVSRNRKRGTLEAEEPELSESPIALLRSKKRPRSQNLTVGVV